MTCDEIQVALEKEARDVVDADERRALAEHVTSCQECRRMRDLIAALAPQSAPEPSAMPARELLGRARRRARRNMLLVVATTATLALLTLLVYPLGHALAVAASGCAIGAFALVDVGRRHRELDRWATEPGDFLAGLRMHLDDQIRAAGGPRLLLGSAILLGVGGRLLLVAGPFGVAAILVASGLFLAAVGLHERFVVLTRLRAERAELGDA